jgi:hypothetical protein
MFCVLLFNFINYVFLLLCYVYSILGILYYFVVLYIVCV